MHNGRLQEFKAQRGQDISCGVGHFPTHLTHGTFFLHFSSRLISKGVNSLTSILIAFSHVLRSINVELCMSVCEKTDIETLNALLVLFGS